MKTLKLSEKPVQPNSIFTRQWVLNEGRKTRAKFTERSNGSYAIEYNGIVQYNRDLTCLQDCIAHAKQWLGSYFGMLKGNEPINIVQ